MAFMNTPVTHGTGDMMVTGAGTDPDGGQDRRHARGDQVIETPLTSS